jgi:hypothetical protein
MNTGGGTNTCAGARTHDERRTMNIEDKIRQLGKDRQKKIEARAEELKQEQASHTPGPWYVSNGVQQEGTQVYHGTMPVCVMNYGGGDIDTARANARLIAAAPDILKALEFVQYAFLRHAMDPKEMGASLSANWELIESAIAKAKGEV